MMKIRKSLIGLLLAFSLTACGNSDGHNIYIDDDGYWVIDGEKTSVKANGENGKDGKDGKDGADGKTVTIDRIDYDKDKSNDTQDCFVVTFSDGSKKTFFADAHRNNGKDGKDGKDGKMPEITIGDNGNWYINGVDSGKKATGEDGKDSIVVKVEKTSSEGLVDTYTVTYGDGRGFTFIVTNGADGKDGDTPYIGSNGNWWIGDTDTGVIADSYLTDDRTPTDDLTFTATVKNGVAGYVVSSYSGYDKNIVIPNYVGTIKVIGVGDNAFEGKNITSVILSKNTNYIGKNAFASCTNLETFDTNDSDIITIKDNAFKGCALLTSLSFGDELTVIGANSFDGCSGLNSIDLGENILSIGDSAFNNCSNLSSVDLGTSLTKIGDEAFSGCSSMASLTLPQSLKTIGKKAFSNCTLMTKVIVPNEVTSIGESAFYNCIGLTEITLPFVGGSQDVAMPKPDTAIYDKTRLFTYIFGGTSITGNKQITQYIPRYYYDSGTAHFEGLDDYNQKYVSFLPLSLKKATITNDKKIDHGALESVSTINEINLCDATLEISNYSFRFCSGLKKISGLRNVTSVSGYAFANNEFLEETDFSSSLLYLGSYVFYKCSSLKYVETSKVQTIGTYCFYGCWALNQYIFSSSIKGIASYAFYENTSFENVELPNNITSVGEQAYGHCSSLKKIFIPKTVLSISSKAFVNCSNLVIYCESDSALSGWSSDWNYSNCPVIWGITRNQYNSITDDQKYITKNDPTYPFSNVSGVLTSTNKVDGTSSTYSITCLKNLKISFDYKVSSEENADFFDVYLNTTRKVHISGETEYKTLSFNASAGDVIKFIYTKDSHDSALNDEAKIRELSIESPSYNESNDSVYPFTVVGGVYTSSNKVNNSTSTYSFLFVKNGTFKFSYGVSSESGYDYFTIMHNNSQIARISGIDAADQSKELQVSSGDTVSFTYSKDSSNNSGNDCGHFKDVLFTPISN